MLSRQAVELDPLLFQRQDAGLHPLPAPQELILHATGADPEERGDVLDRHVLVVAHAQHRLLSCWMSQTRSSSRTMERIVR